MISYDRYYDAFTPIFHPGPAVPANPVRDPDPTTRVLEFKRGV